MLGISSNEVEEPKSKVLPNISEIIIAPKEIEIGFEIEDITNKEISILERIRGAVDANISDIVGRIGNNLYAEYGIAPRKPNKIFKVSYKDSSVKEYNILYEEKKSEVIQKMVVITDEKGNISSVYTSK